VWEQIRSNRRRSVAVVGGMGVLLVAMGVTAGSALFRSDGALIGGVVAMGLWLVLWLTSAQGGDELFLHMAGARKIERQDHPVLTNVVEEMAIAARLDRVPAVYVVDDPAPNAFATGRRPEKSAVAVTTGLLGLLDRDELQGVVAHEIGHIKNRDVSLMVTAGVMLGAIVLMAEITWRSLRFGGAGIRSRSSSRDSGRGQVLLLVLALLFMLVAPLLAQLLYFALSRRREYLADASGAMFSRYPEGLASALEKLGGSRQKQVDQSKVTAPMYIVRPRAAHERAASSLFSTHPPIQERVRILRSMGGGAGLAAYDDAFRRVRGRSVVGAGSLAEARDVPARGAAGAEPAAERAQRVRQASDALLKRAGYAQRACGRCGATLKIPPALATRVTRCLRCGGPLGEPGAGTPA